MNAKQTIKFNVVDSKSHRIFEKTPAEALEYIRNYSGNEGGWIYLNGNKTNLEAVTEDSLKSASTVTVGNIILGG